MEGEAEAKVNLALPTASGDDSLPSLVFEVKLNEGRYVDSSP